MNDIQQIGMLVMLLPSLAMLILLAFAVYHLAVASLAEREQRNSRKPNKWVAAKPRDRSRI